MHLNWVKGSLQLPGSRGGARDKGAASPAGLHTLPARHGPCCPVVSDPEGQQKPVPAPAPHVQSQRTSAVEWTFTGSRPSLLNQCHHIHRTQAQTVSLAETPEPISPCQLGHVDSVLLSFVLLSPGSWS